MTQLEQPPAYFAETIREDAMQAAAQPPQMPADAAEKAPAVQPLSTRDTLTLELATAQGALAEHLGVLETSGTTLRQFNENVKAVRAGHIELQQSLDQTLSDYQDCMTALTTLGARHDSLTTARDRNVQNIDTNTKAIEDRRVVIRYYEEQDDARQQQERENEAALEKMNGVQADHEDFEMMMLTVVEPTGGVTAPTREDGGYETKEHKEVLRLRGEIADLQNQIDVWTEEQTGLNFHINATETEIHKLLGTQHEIEVTIGRLRTHLADYSLLERLLDNVAFKRYRTMLLTHDFFGDSVRQEQPTSVEGGSNVD